VAQYGLSSVTPEKLQRTIDAVVTAYGLPNSPNPASVYTDHYLPPLAERMAPKRPKVNIPRQSRGLYVKSRSKRLVGGR
jgi:hypothetical protein